MRYRGQFVYITSSRGLLLFKVFICGGKGVVDGFGWFWGMLQESEWSLLGSQIGAFPFMAPAFGCSSCEPQSSESIFAMCAFKGVEAPTSETAKRDSAMRSEIVTKDLRF